MTTTTKELVPLGGPRAHGRNIARTPVTSLQPQSWRELTEFAEAISKSTFIPREFIGKPGDIIACVQYGAELGLAAMQSLQSICVINGKPSLYGDSMLALIRAARDVDGSRLLEEFEEWLDKDPAGKLTGATCRSKRRGWPVRETQFTIAQAQKAGLLGKPGPWQQYPERMLQFRARSWNLRDTFGDVLKGLQMAEEVSDYIEAPLQTATEYREPAIDVPAIEAKATVPVDIAGKDYLREGHVVSLPGNPSASACDLDEDKPQALTDTQWKVLQVKALQDMPGCFVTLTDDSEIGRDAARSFLGMLIGEKVERLSTLTAEQIRAARQELQDRTRNREVFIQETGVDGENRDDVTLLASRMLDGLCIPDLAALTAAQWQEALEAYRKTIADATASLPLDDNDPFKED